MKSGYRPILMALTAFGALIPSFAPALTVRTKSDLRLWETVTDRSRPLSWSWQDGADAAVLTFSNRLTRAVAHTNVTRTAGALRGSCAPFALDVADEALVAVTLLQSAGGVELSRAEAELAYVPGVCCVATSCVATAPSPSQKEVGNVLIRDAEISIGEAAAKRSLEWCGVATQPIVVRAKAEREWWRVRRPRLAAFDACWWNVAGPSGYEVLWEKPAGPHLVVREFEGVGVVDEIVLKFGTSGLLLLLR